MPFYNTKLILQITEQFALITEDYSILKKQLMKCESEQSQMTSKDKVMKKLVSCRKDIDGKNVKISSLQELIVKTNASLSICQERLETRNQAQDNGEAASAKKKGKDPKITKHKDIINLTNK